MPEEAGGVAFFGRRKGKRLRAGQQERLDRLLPDVLIDHPAARAALEPADLFGSAKTEIRLEIGFGSGEHVASQAVRHPDIGFIGVEPFVNGVAKLTRMIEEHAIGNIRVWNQDVGLLLPAIAAGSIQRVDLLYPDPWPKRRQRKRRLFSSEMLQRLARVMMAGGQLRFVTDIDDYAGWALAEIRRSQLFVWSAARADEWRHPPSDWFSTRYEQKALREGRKPTYLAFRRL